MKKIELDSLNGLDLSAIAYALAFLIALFTKASLVFMFFLASALCAYVSFKKSKISLTVLNSTIFLYSAHNLWRVIGLWWDKLTATIYDATIGTVVNAWEQLTANLPSWLF